ncbi:MAG: ATP-binding protein [Lachnospiraceae bacterium]|nr:ATP-binding protein [Lachnospiraceae bacterium]
MLLKIFTVEDIKNEMLEVVFVDDGVHFDTTGYDAQESDFELLDDGGMGISIIRQTAAAVKYERADEKNILTLDFEI